MKRVFYANYDVDWHYNHNLQGPQNSDGSAGNWETSWGESGSWSTGSSFWAQWSTGWTKDPTKNDWIKFRITTGSSSALGRFDIQDKSHFPVRYIVQGDAFKKYDVDDVIILYFGNRRTPNPIYFERLYHLDTNARNVTRKSGIQ